MRVSDLVETANCIIVNSIQFCHWSLKALELIFVKRMILKSFIWVAEKPKNSIPCVEFSILTHVNTHRMQSASTSIKEAIWSNWKVTELWTVVGRNKLNSKIYLFDHSWIVSEHFVPPYPKLISNIDSQKNSIHTQCTVKRWVSTLRCLQLSMEFFRK